MMDMINWKWISNSFWFMSLVDPMAGSVDGGSGQDPELRGELRQVLDRALAQRRRDSIHH